MSPGSSRRVSSCSRVCPLPLIRLSTSTVENLFGPVRLDPCHRHRRALATISESTGADDGLIDRQRRFRRSGNPDQGTSPDRPPDCPRSIVFHRDRHLWGPQKTTVPISGLDDLCASLTVQPATWTSPMRYRLMLPRGIDARHGGQIRFAVHHHAQAVGVGQLCR